MIRINNLLELLGGGPFVWGAWRAFARPFEHLGVILGNSLQLILGRVSTGGLSVLSLFLPAAPVQMI